MSMAIYKATEMLIEELWEEEKLSLEIKELASKRGISYRTLERAKAKLEVKPRRNGGKWSMYLPAESKEKAFAILSEMKEKARLIEAAQKVTREKEHYEVSTDWVMITSTTDGAERMVEVAPQADVVRIKAGGYEIEAGCGFPLEKLVEVLRAVNGGELK